MTPTLLPLHPVPRLSLDPTPSRRAVVNGAWWPRSRDAAAELPGLVAAGDQRLGRTTLLVGLHPDAWRHIPDRIPARGRLVRVGRFRGADPHVVVLFFAAVEPVALLLIPPDTAAGPAQNALTRAARHTADLTADDLLALTRLPTAV
ncbi:DUF5994 family protein [Nonomuraea sp. NPDC050540]|uniref:DUF5994 family protein n=1 Tax=Nonomuraea sp. NPDC050540 TaxID=3364367 RepID=UPI00378A70B5